MNLAPLSWQPLAGYQLELLRFTPGAQLLPCEPRVRRLRLRARELGERRQQPPLARASRPGIRKSRRCRLWEPNGQRYPFPAQLRPELRSLHRNAAGSRLSEPERCPGSCSLGTPGRGEPGDSANHPRAPRVGPGHTRGYHPVLHLPDSGTSLPSGTRTPGNPEQSKEPREARCTQELAAGSHQVAPRRVRYLPSRPLRMPGGAAARNPGPSPASGPQAEPQPRRAASRGAAGGFSVSFRALAGTGLPGARCGRGRECTRVGR